MSGQPWVSVVIPCLNRAHFLSATIESVLRQDYPHIECIVVDGGSSDGTIALLRRYEGRLRWISEPDQGHADAINKGWRMSRGEILAWLNADDLWAVPNAVSQAVAYLQDQPDVDVVYGDCTRIDADGHVVGMSYSREWNFAYALEHCDHCIPQPAAFLRRRIVERVGWLDPQFISKKDHELWLRIGLVGTIRHFPLVLAHERACPGHWSRRGDITAAACVALTKKIFAQPDFPADLRQRHRRAIGNAYLRGARYAYRDGGHYGLALAYVARSVWLHPGNAGAVLRYVGRAVRELFVACWDVLRRPRRAFLKARESAC